MMRLLIKPLLAIIYLTLTCGLLYLTTDSFFVAHGSDSGVSIISGSVIFKAISAFVAIVILIISSTKKGWKQFAVGFVLSTVIIGLASHTIVFNHKRGVLEDQWFLYASDKLNYDIADGMGLDWNVESVFLGFEITAKKGNSSVFIFTGPAPWKTPFNAMLEENYETRRP